MRQRTSEPDLSEQKQEHAGKELNNSGIEMDRLINSLAEVIITVRNPGKTIEYSNHAVENILGYKTEEFVGQQGMDFLFPDDETLMEFNKKIKYVLDQGENILRTEHSLKRKNGESFPAEITVTFFKENDRVTRTINIIRDISYRKEVEEKLKLEEQLLDSANDAIFVRNLKGDYIYVNEMACKSLGYSKKELLNMNLHQIVTPEYSDHLDERTKELLEKGQRNFETINIHRDGTQIPVEVHARAIKFEGEKYILSVVRDIRERKKTEEELKLKAQLLDSANDAIFVRDIEGRIIYVNEMTCKSLGYSREELLNMNLRQITSKEYTDNWVERTQQLLTKGEREFETAQFRKDGSIVPIEVHARVIKSGNTQFILSVCRDITERKKIEEELKLRAQLLDNANDTIIVRDLDGSIVYVNEMACKSLGYTREELLKMNLRQITSQDYADSMVKRTKELLDKGQGEYETSQLRKDGTAILIEVHARVIESGGKKFIVSVCRDITERKKAEQEMERLANYDLLTGLYNRRAILNKLDDQRKHARRYNEKLSLIMLDIDHFKKINDQHGHATGDYVLEKVATLIRTSIRATDTVGRYGEEEFIIILPHADLISANYVAERVRTTIESTKMERANKQVFNITISGGVSSYKSRDDIYTLISRSDDALYRAKRNGRNRIEIETTASD